MSDLKEKIKAELNECIYVSDFDYTIGGKDLAAEEIGKIADQHADNRAIEYGIWLTTNLQNNQPMTPLQSLTAQLKAIEYELNKRYSYQIQCQKVWLMKEISELNRISLKKK